MIFIALITSFAAISTFSGCPQSTYTAVVDSTSARDQPREKILPCHKNRNPTKRTKQSAIAAPQKYYKISAAPLSLFLESTNPVLTTN